MASRELLHRLVDGLDESQAAEALTWIRARYAMPDPARDDTALPEWVGSFASGGGDLAECHEEILRDDADER
ncbi:hypothetical protein [Glycomyces arizonensis]|uniref:hypothetical protein n=1 Tax=Glycomyces arizonensis TaxID=256035 RepID=UPI0003F5D128|nr:hypothetical protein [Glycomyces arizonensis]